MGYFSKKWTHLAGLICLLQCNSLGLFSWKQPTGSHNNPLRWGQRNTLLIQVWESSIVRWVHSFFLEVLARAQRHNYGLVRKFFLWRSLLKIRNHTQSYFPKKKSARNNWPCWFQTHLLCFCNNVKNSKYHSWRIMMPKLRYAYIAAVG